jgi:prophage regulatory protein
VHDHKFTEKYLTVSEVAQRLGISVNTTWRWARQRQDFPHPVKIGPGCTRWRLSDLVSFEASLEVSQ